MDLVNLSVGNAALIAVGGYLVVFIGIVLLMFFVILLGKILGRKKAEKKEEKAAAVTVSAEPIPEKVKAPGSCGELKLYDTDPKDAALIMAIVANKLGKPLNELRFLSIREVKDHEI